MTTTELIMSLGESGGVTVWLARQPVLQRDCVALVVDTSALSPQRLAAFRNGAIRLADIDHPAALHVFDLDEQASGLRLVLERRLVTPIDRIGLDLDPTTAAAVVLDLLSGVRAIRHPEHDAFNWDPSSLFIDSEGHGVVGVPGLVDPPAWFRFSEPPPDASTARALAISLAALVDRRTWAEPDHAKHVLTDTFGAPFAQFVTEHLSGANPLDRLHTQLQAWLNNSPNKPLLAAFAAGLPMALAGLETLHHTSAPTLVGTVTTATATGTASPPPAPTTWPAPNPAPATGISGTASTTTLGIATKIAVAVASLAVVAGTGIAIRHFTAQADKPTRIASAAPIPTTEAPTEAEVPETPSPTTVKVVDFRNVTLDVCGGRVDFHDGVGTLPGVPPETQDGAPFGATYQIDRVDSRHNGALVTVKCANIGSSGETDSFDIVFVDNSGVMRSSSRTSAPLVVDMLLYSSPTMRNSTDEVVYENDGFITLHRKFIDDNPEFVRGTWDVAQTFTIGSDGVTIERTGADVVRRQGSLQEPPDGDTVTRTAALIRSLPQTRRSDLMVSPGGSGDVAAVAIATNPSTDDVLIYPVSGDGNPSTEGAWTSLKTGSRFGPIGSFPPPPPGWSSIPDMIFVYWSTSDVTIDWFVDIGWS